MAPELLKALATVPISGALLSSVLRGEVLGIEDLKNAIPACGLTDIDFSVYVFATGPKGKRSPVASLCLTNFNQTPMTFNSFKEFASCHVSNKKNHAKRQGAAILTFSSPHSMVFVFIKSASDDRSTAESFNQLTHVIELIFASSMSAKNLWEDQTITRMADLEALMRIRNFNIRELSNFIGARHIVNIAIFERKASWQMTFVRTSKRSKNLTNEIVQRLFTVCEQRLEQALTTCASSGKVHEIRIDSQRVIEMPDNDTEFHDRPTPILAFTIPVKRLNAASFNVKEVLVIFDADPNSKMTHFRLDAIQELVDRFLFLKYQRGRSQFITSLFERSIHPAGLSFHTSGELEQRADGLIAGLVCENLFSLTKAHSVAFLKYDPWTNSLIRPSCPIELSAGTTVQTRELDVSIPLSEFESRLSAFTFLHGIAGLPRSNDQVDGSGRILDRIAYIPNVDAEETGYVDLRRVKKHRDTLSEVCIPLAIGGTPYGVINLESPLINAFDGDIEFFVLVQQAVEGLLSNIYKSNDHLWINIGMQQATLMHEIENCALKIVPEDEASATNKLKLLYYVGDSLNKKFFLDAPPVDLMIELRASITKTLLQHRGFGPTYTGFMSRINFVVRDGIRVRREFWESVDSICRILVTNSLLHESYRDRINIEVKRNMRGIDDLLCIDVLYSRGESFAQALLDVAFDAPYLSGRRDRLGLFLVGSIARSWGGWVYFEREDNRTTRRARITLPLSASIFTTPRVRRARK
jgi:hypothetical protein